MKQRITYVVAKPETFSPEQINVQKGDNRNRDTFTLKGVNAAKEHRITLGVDELSQAPIDLKALKQWRELHIRWASDVPYSATPPFTSRVSPGVHIFFTPSGDRKDIELCNDIKSFFGQHLKCTSFKETAFKMPMLSERFSTSTALQYYSPFSANELDKSILSKWFCLDQDVVCDRKASLLSASYIDLDYDAISQAWIFTAVWSNAPNEDGWVDTITAPSDQSTVEIGVLAHEPNTDPEDIQFGGFLTVLGRDDKPKPTRFQTPTRHYPLLNLDPYNPKSTPKLSPLTYTTLLQRPTGLHPTLILTFPTEHFTPPHPTCKLHTHLTLPSTLFIDKYQFNDPLFLASKNLVALRSIAGATDLEAPNWVIPQWGSAALFELASPSSSIDETKPDPNSQFASANVHGHWNISIPLHLRYLSAANVTHTPITLPWPVVFWACRADEGEKMSANPFDRRHLGYEALFGPKTRFMHVQPALERKMVETIHVPVLDTRRAAWVEMGTVGVVLVSFLGLCWVLFGKKGEKVEVEKKKQ